MINKRVKLKIIIIYAILYLFSKDYELNNILSRDSQKLNVLA